MVKRLIDFLIGQWNLALLLVMCAVVVAIQTFGLLPQLTTLPLILGLLVTFMLYQIIENLKMSEALGRISGQKTPGMAVKILPSLRDFFSFATLVVESANVTIDACYFTPHPPTIYFKDKNVKRYWDVFGKLIRTRKNVTFRRIITPDTKEKVTWIRSNLAEFTNHDNYSVGILQNNPQVPILNVMVVDGKNAFIFNPHSAETRNYLWIEDQVFCRGIQEYFDNLWRSSLMVKEGPYMRTGLLDEIEKDLK